MSFLLQYIMLFEIIYLEMMNSSLFLLLYKRKNYQVIEKLNISTEELKNVLDYMFQCCKYGYDKAGVQARQDDDIIHFFDRREMDHLNDIHSILKVCYCGLVMAAILFLLLAMLLHFKRKTSFFFKTFLWSEAIIVAVIIAILTLESNSMLGVVNTFHRMIFKNNRWVMNPVTDKMIYFFPVDLFKQLTVYMATRIIIQWGVLSIFFMKKLKNSI